ncbi:uncharacterized protein KY384_003303 [Bacidia gigantensis]|uniref:uncharacterized protein n=1 Tax=Bacidia gigantensis TaxID=2732470 RepID=UPI001D051B17|nr:uncharacterized protein KY384_003303 [Bacidia gigantensis]KAG8531671.1 hypothetical protein KY384_003303 [Bacidia gigantensis]
MSRYGDYSPRGPPAERWTPERFERERGGRRSSVLERDRYEERDTYSSVGGNRRRDASADELYSRGGGGTHEDDRYYDRQERFGPPARQPQGGGRERDTRYHEEDYESGRGGRQTRYHEEDYEVDSFAGSPTRGGRSRGYEDDRRFSAGRRNPPRPGGLIRRQSSLDTFDRKPTRPRYGPPRPPSPPEIIAVPGPGRHRRSSPPRYGSKGGYDDIGVAEPDRYGDDNFHGWKEREIETIRRRRRSSSPRPRERELEREEIIQEDIITEQPYPRKGRTKMSAHLVNKRALVDLGYPFEEDFTDEGHFIIILKALNKELIDLVLLKSKEYNERGKERLYAIEGPPPPPNRGEIIERREIIIDKADSEVPRSVREWDVMSGTAGGGGGHSHAGKSDHKSKHGDHKSEHRSEHLSVHESHHGGRSKSRGRSPHGSSHTNTTIKISKSRERSHSPEKELVIERKPSKSHRHHSRHRSHGRKKEYIEEEVQEVGESNKMHTGPLALVLPTRSKSRRGSERKVKEEIRELEIEKETLRKERKRRGSRARRRRASSSSSSSSSGGDTEVVIERKSSHGGREDVKIEKDRRGKMQFVR